MSSIAKILLSTDPAERQWYEDQFTVNAHARRQLRGNSRIVVLVTNSGGELAVTPEGFDSTDPEFIARACKRVIDGRVLFTARDNPRPYKAPKVKA